MIRSLFDDAERRPLTVSQLTAYVKGALETRFASVWVEGEISNFNPAPSGHWYFTLKDHRSQLHAACYRSVNLRIRFRPTNGLLVRVRGRITVYDQRGEYQLLIDAIEPVGAGALRIAFEQLRDRLTAEGLFDKTLKRDLPLLPRRIGVVTSLKGAALVDIIRTIRRRTRTVNLLIVPARVQGDGAAREISRALRFLTAHHLRAISEGRFSDAVDAIIVGRGGGSAEDLWAFNEEDVARAIRASAVPVISAVGHETDFTIADFAADVRAATPTAAAEIVASREDEIALSVKELTNNLTRSIRYQLMMARSKVHKAAMSYGFADVRERVHRVRRDTVSTMRALERLLLEQTTSSRHRLATASRRLSPEAMAARAVAGRGRLAATQTALESNVISRVDDARKRIGIAAASLHALSPLAVLGRGYALARDDQGRLLRDTRSVEIGDKVTVRLSEGELGCRVESIDEAEVAQDVGHSR